MKTGVIQIEFLEVRPFRLINFFFFFLLLSYVHIVIIYVGKNLKKLSFVRILHCLKYKKTSNLNIHIFSYGFGLRGIQFF